MTVHELKCWANYFDAVEDGCKTFEVRVNDRGYQKGDILHLHRTRHGSVSSVRESEKRRDGTYSPLAVEVLYVHPLGTIAPQHVVLAIRLLPESKQTVVTPGIRIELPQHDRNRRIGGPDVQRHMDESWQRRLAQIDEENYRATIAADSLAMFEDLFDGDCPHCLGEGTVGVDDDCDFCQGTGERSREDTVREVLRRLSLDLAPRMWANGETNVGDVHIRTCPSDEGSSFRMYLGSQHIDLVLSSNDEPISDSYARKIATSVAFAMQQMAVAQDLTKPTPHICDCCSACHPTSCDRSPDDWTCSNRPCRCSEVSEDSDMRDGSA